MGHKLLTRIHYGPPAHPRPDWHAPLQSALRSLGTQAESAAAELDYGPLPEWRLVQLQGAFHQVRLALAALAETQAADGQ